MLRRSKPKLDGVISDPLGAMEDLLDNVEHGRFERSMAALTAVGAIVTTGEVWMEHDKASFSNKMMWLPVVIAPGLAVAAVGGAVSRRWAKSVLPAMSAILVANGLQGTYLHLRGVSQRPGGFTQPRYNFEMGPPLFAPLLVTLVGGMGLLAAVLRRER